MSEIKWWEEQFRLWDELVPKSGQASTLQGELIRCTGKFTDEAYLKGNINWESGYERLVRFVTNTLVNADIFTPEQRQNIVAAAADIIKNFESPDITGPGSSYYYLMEMTVYWCIAQPKPIPYKADPTLNI